MRNRHRYGLGYRHGDGLRHMYRHGHGIRHLDGYSHRVGYRLLYWVWYRPLHRDGVGLGYVDGVGSVYRDSNGDLDWHWDFSLDVHRVGMRHWYRHFLGDGNGFHMTFMY